MLLATVDNIKIALNNIISDFKLKIMSFADSPEKFCNIRLPKLFIYAPSRDFYIGLEFVHYVDPSRNPRDIEFYHFEMNINVYIDKEFVLTFDSITLSYFSYYFDTAIDSICLSISHLVSKYYFEKKYDIHFFNTSANENFKIVFNYAEIEFIQSYPCRPYKRKNTVLTNHNHF